MSAVFTGNGLGLFNTSLTQLGSVLGAGAGVGQGRNNQYVNLATGNLVWQSTDEHLVFRGLSVGLNRTYNSLGQLADVGADGWITGFERRVGLLSGTFNASGSVMRRFTGDGGYQDFVYVSNNSYRSTTGDGAHDSLTWTGSAWSYVEGSTLIEEQYADHADAVLQGRLTLIQDRRTDGGLPVQWQVLYDGNQRIAEIRAANGSASADALVFGYDAAGRLSSISTRENGAVRHQVAYAYDGQGRLASVLTDLTPGNAADNTWNASNAAGNDGHLFRTEYTYEGSSLRLASVRQSDGTVVSYTYHADGRIKTVTRGDTNTNDADGLGETTSYAYDAATTTVTDSLGRAWVYGYDARGQLTSMVSPAVDGQSDLTSYQYDADGNLLQTKSVRGSTTLSLVDYRYDANGNVLWQWDGLGNAVSNTYNAQNQLSSQTRYTGVDSDRAGSGVPTGGMTTRYLYDERSRLRFVVDAMGQVTEFSYATSGNGIGQQSSVRQYLGASYGGAYSEAAITAWTSGQQMAQSQLSEFGYDAWGRLSQRTDYAVVAASGAGVLDAAAAITRFTYDAQGLLRQQISVRGAGRTADGAAPAGSQQVDYSYDGMGRLLGVVTRQVGAGNDDASTLETSYSYLDSGHQVMVTTDAGVTRIETRSAAGNLVSVSESGQAGGGTQVRGTRNYYDAAGQLRASEDAAGKRSYFFYDAKGRLEATVDATGALNRTFYDGAGRVVGTREYAALLTTGDWLQNGQVKHSQVDALPVVANTALDRVSSRTYDAAGRLLTQTDGPEASAARAITTYTYDGAGQLLQVRTSDSVGTAATAQLVRYFYDQAGRQVAMLDAAGYLTEVQYDLGGRIQSQTRYATLSPSAQLASGTLAQLRPGANAAQDQTTRYFYDGRGQKIGQLDAAGYLTQWIIDEAGNTRAERRHATALVWASTDSLATLRARAGTYREQRMAYNALGQLATQTDAEGTVTRYSYDDAGRLVKTEQAQGTSEVREGNRRYNAFGELIGELSGEGALRLLPGMTEAQLDAVYAQYGVRHGYDALGRRIESIDAAGNRTWYFYNAAGQQTFQVRGVADDNNLANALGEVTEQRYNAFGETTDSISYTGRIVLSVPGSRDSVQAALGVLSYAAATDSRRQYTYTNRGQLASLVDAQGGTTQYSYDAFGQLSQEVRWAGTANAMTVQYRYDARGLQTRVIEGVGSAVERARSVAFDAFGRVISSVDGRGATHTASYDRLGRQLTTQQTVGLRVESTSTSYDAYGRIVSASDAMGQVTTYVHDDAARSLTMTSPEGVAVTTIHNRHGQTVRISDASGFTDYTYNRNGQLTATQRKASDGTLITSQTDEFDEARGLLTATVDGSGRRVEFTYDAAGRLLRRVVDPAGQALATRYQYDGQGRQLSVTDPSGRLTQYSYDREGRLLQAAVDPAGLNLLTRYAYDVAGRQVTLVEGSGSVARTTQYSYDLLGRRISEVVDPGAGKLNLTTTYAYDSNDNLIRRTDANGQVSRFYYDSANRQIYAIDPLGAMTRQWYDAAGRVVASRVFVQPTNAATLTDADTIAQLDARLTWSDADQTSYRVVDRDGRQRWLIRANGEVQESLYDGAGRLVGERAYAAKYYPDTALASKFLAGTAGVGDIVIARNDALDQRSYRVLDAAGQVRLLVDGLGNVQQRQYDLAGRLVGTIAYSRPAILTAALRSQLEAGTSTVAGIMATVVADAAKDSVGYRVHDAAGRLRYSIDAIGAVRETLFDAAGQVVGERAHAVPISISTALRSRLQAGTAAASEISALLAAADADVRNQEQFQVRDAAGRIRFVVEIVRDVAGAATGTISELRYDAVGRLIERAESPTLVASAALSAQMSALRAGTASLATLASWMIGTSRQTAWVHDAAGRVRYTLLADTASTWAVSERRYDALGQVVAEVAYAAGIASTTGRTEAAIAAALSAAGGDAAAQQRVTRTWWDAAGHVRFRMDDAGAVTEFHYDGAGRVVENRQYMQLVSTTTSMTEAAMTAAVAGQTGANVRITKTAYDSGNRIATVTDAAGNTETYAYDGIGRRLRLTNKLGHYWTYVYDAAGRMTEETSPAIVVASAGMDGVVSTASRGIKTVLAYDALGNLLSRTEDATGSAPRVTQYQYDSRGNQVRTIFPDAWQVNAAGELVATGKTPTIEVSYNALGQAVVQKDVRGNYSYRVYDALGRLATEIDTEGQATSYTYSAFGEQTQLRRHATKVNFAAISGFSAGNEIRLNQLGATVLPVVAAQDRVLTSSYDRRGQKVEIKQSAISYIKADGSSASGTPTTQFSYNGYGEVVRTSVLVDQAAGLWAHTYRYYDDLGRNTLSVDAEGYVTQTRYNAMGETIEVKEYARALPATLLAGLTIQSPPPPPSPGDAALGYDRVTQFTYDAMGRKTSETTLRNYGRADGSQGVRNVATEWSYDAAGQVVATRVDGRQSKTRYDALGRVLSVQEAPQKTLLTTAEGQLLGSTDINLGSASLYASVSPYTAMAYDAFGNAVQIIRYTNGLKDGQSAPTANSGEDQVTVTLFDRQGRAVMNRDAEGNRFFLQYDAADNVVHSWRTLTGNSGRSVTAHSYYSYDTTGRQLSTRTERVDGAGKVFVDQREAVRYNAFGEIVAKGDNDAAGASLQAEYQYDLAGNLIRSNAEGGVWHDYGYDLAGHQVREAHSVYVGPGNVTAVTRTITDRLGRTLMMILPSHTQNVAEVNYLTQKLDRWGNVIERVDPNGYRIDYQYNDRNQLVREVRPLVKVVTTNAAGTWQRPEQNWYYDELGRLVAMRDANGNVTRYEYDGTRQVKVTDANGDSTITAYDVLGRARLAQNGLGYITFKQYDRLDRVTSHGDYLPSGNGAARSKKTLESYTLNENGNRLASTDALGKLTRYDYDTRGLMIRSQTATGVVMEYAYDMGGRRSLERYALSHSELTDRDGETVRTNEQTWDYDYFGRLIDHNDLSGRDYNYAYDAASGLLTNETNSTGLNRSTLYYANGQVREISEAGGTVYRYAYDKAGNRILEEAETKDSRAKQFKVSTQITYDSHNRIQRIVQDDAISNQRVFELTYDYDAAGNRTHVVARTGYGTNTTPIDKIDNPPVVIALPPARVVRTGVASEFRVRLTDIFRDPEGKPLSVTAGLASGSGIAALPSWLSYRVDAATGEAVFTATTGSSAANGQSFTLRLTAKDAANGTASTDFSLTVRSNTAPSDAAGATISYPVKTGRPWSLDLPVDTYFVDPDVGDSLSLSVTVSPAAPWLTIDNSNPAVSRLSAAAPVAGTYTLTLKATDQLGATKTRTVTLVVAANAAPTVVSAIPAQTATQNRAFLLERDVSAVFRDTQGDVVRVQATLDSGAALPSWLSFSFLGDQATPRLRFNGDVPGSIANGTVFKIKLTAIDPDGATVSTTFNLTVVANRAPTVVSTPATQQVRIGQQLNLQTNVANLFRDPDGDAMAYELLHPEGTTRTGWVGLQVDYETGQLSLTGTPTNATNHIGTYTVQIRARDIEGLTQVVTVTLQVKGDNAPVRNTAVPLPDQTVRIGRSFSFTLPDNLFTDPDGDPVTLSVAVVKSYQELLDTVPPKWIYWIESAPLPSWMSYNAATRTFSGTVPAGEPASSFVVRVGAHDGRKYYDGGDQAGAANKPLDADITINVVPFVNTAPIYNSGTLPNRTLVHGGTVDFALPAGAFTEPDGDVLSYSAEVQVGGVWTNISALGLSINASTGRITGTAGNLVQASYAARIIARDPQGGSVAGTFTFAVTNTAPTAGTIPAQTVYRNIAFSFSIASYFSDVNNDTLTFLGSQLPVGTSLSSAGLVSGTMGTIGDYTISVTASDGRGGSVTRSFTLAVANSAPTAPTIPNQTATAGSAWSYVVPAFADPNGDTLTYTASGLPSWMSFNAGTRTLSGAAAPVGSWTITVTAKDTSGAAVGKSFIVTTPNVAPVVAAAIGNRNANRNQAWSFQIPANTFSDANGDSLSYSVGTLPAGISFNASTRTFSGTPTALGNYTVTVTVADGNGGTRSTSFVLSVVNNPPTYNGGLATRSAQRAQSISWALPANTFSDANGDALSYTLMVERPGYWQPYEIVPGEPDIRWVEAAWFPASNYSLAINAGNGTITGTPYPMVLASANPRVQGTVIYSYRIKVVASDGAGGSAEGIFTLNVNDPPTGSVPDRTIKSAVQWSYQLPAFSDPNGDTLTYGVSNLPAGLSFNAGTRTLSGAVATAGVYTIQVTVSDGKGGSVQVPFKLTVQANTAPTAPAIGNLTGTVGTAFSYTVPVFSDADNDTLTYSAGGLPAGLSFNAGTRTISGTPTAPGANTVTITANDGRGGSVSRSFTLTINAATPPNRAPVVNRQPPSPAYSFFSTNRYIVPVEGFTLPTDTFVDPDNNPLTYTVVQKPAWLSYSYNAGSGHSFSGVSNDTRSFATHTIQIRATDPAGLSVLLTFTVTSTYDYYDPRNPTEPLSLPGGPVQLFQASEEPAAPEAPASSATATATAATTMAATATAAPRVEESWYAYDKLNRVSIVNGALQNGQVVLAANYLSYGIGYDAAGNQISQYQLRPTAGTAWTATIKQQTYSLRGELLLTFNEQRLDGSGAAAGVVERRVYDDAGRQVQRLQYYSPGTVIRYVDMERTLMPVSVGGWLYQAELTTYDDDGRLLSQVQRTRSDATTRRSPYGSNVEVEFPTWIAEAWDGSANQRSDLAVLTQVATTSYAGAGLGYDAAGRVIGYSYTGKSYTHTYTYQYAGWDGYREQSITGTSNNSTYKTTTTTLSYDVAGRQTELREKTVGQVLDDRIRSFAYDGSGQILSRRDGTANASNVFSQGTAAEAAYKNQHFVYAGGQQVASLDEAGKLDALSRMTAFSNTDTGRTQITVQAGDTLQTIAHAYAWNNLETA